MEASNLTQEMKRHAVVIALAANRSDSEIASFLKVTRSFVLKVRNELEASGEDASPVPKQKKHSKQSDNIRTAELVQQVQDIINQDPKKSSKAIAKQLKVTESTVRHIVSKEVKYNHDKERAVDA